MRAFSSPRSNLLTGRLAASLVACAAGVALSGCKLELESEATPTSTVDEPEAALASQSAAVAHAVATTSILTVGGVTVGRVASVSGGSKKGTVTRASNGNKYLTYAGYEATQLSVSGNMNRKLGEWLSACWTGSTHAAKDLEVDSVDFNQKIQSTLTLRRAKVIEARFPALVNRDTPTALGDVVLKIDQEVATRQSGSDANAPVVPATGVIDGFEFTLGNLGGEIQKIDSFTVALPVSNPPNLLVTMTRESADHWIEWADHFIVENPTHPPTELDGSIELRSGDTTVATITLHNVGIVRLSDTPTASRPATGVDSLTGEIFVESATVSFP